MRLQHHTALTKPPTRPQAWTCESLDPAGSAQLLNAFHVSHFLRPAFGSGVLYFANEVGKADAVISGLGAPWIRLGLEGLRSGRQALQGCGMLSQLHASHIRHV